VSLPKSANPLVRRLSHEKLPALEHLLLSGPAAPHLLKGMEPTLWMKLTLRRLMSHTNELRTQTLMRPSEAAAHFDVPLRTIYFWYRVGKIDGINVNGKCLRIFSKSLQEFLGTRRSSEWGEPYTGQGLTGGAMLRRHNGAKNHAVRGDMENGEAVARDVVITPFETEMLGVLAEMLGVLADAAKESAAMRGLTHAPALQGKTAPAFGA
jgi:hypothetical protein